MPRNISAANILLRRSFLLSSILCFCHIRKTTLKARNLYQAICIFLAIIAPSISTVNPIPLKNQFCWRILRMQPFFPSASPIIFDIFAALDPAPDLHMSAHIKTGGKSCISSPADARNVIWFSIRAVHSDQKICDLSSKRCFPVNWLLTYIAV